MTTSKRRRRSLLFPFIFFCLAPAFVSAAGAGLAPSVSLAGGNAGDTLPDKDFPVTMGHKAETPCGDTDPDVDFSARIIGTAKGAEGREILWRADADMLSGQYREIGRAKIDDSGRFVLKSREIGRILPTYLVIDYYSAALFAEPGKTYYLRMEDFDYHADERMNAFVASNRLPELRYRLFDAEGRPDTAGLNYLIGRYSYYYNRMLASGFEKVMLAGDTFPVHDFLHFSDSLFARVAHPYFQAYREYAEALLKDFSGMSSRRELFEQHLDGRVPDAGNPAQADFLRNYFTEYFRTNRFLPFSQARRIIQQENLPPGQRAKALSDSMGLDYALRNEVLREWVLVYALGQLWEEGSVEPSSVRALLEHLSANAKSDLNAASAKALVEARDRRFFRHYFSGIRLRGLQGEEFLVDSLLQAGKFHYFVFLRADYANCPACGEELHRLAQEWEKAGPEIKASVEVVLVNCDYEHARYVHHARAERYPWRYLHFNRNVEWIREIDASRFPSFFLVDDKGNVLDAEFNAPSQGIADVFAKMARLRMKREEPAP